MGVRVLEGKACIPTQVREQHSTRLVDRRDGAGTKRAPREAQAPAVAAGAAAGAAVGGTVMERHGGQRSYRRWGCRLMRVQRPSASRRRGPLDWQHKRTKAYKGVVVY